MIFDRTYGRVVISKLLAERKCITRPSDNLVEKLYTSIYQDFIEEIDARDNGFDNPYTIKEPFLDHLIKSAMELLPEDKPIQPTKPTNKNRKTVVSPTKSSSKPLAVDTIMGKINQFSGIKFMSRFSGRLGLSGVSTEVAKLNVAAIYTARTLSNQESNAEGIASNILSAENKEDAEKYQKELQKILLNESKLEEDSENVFAIQRNVHFNQGVQLLSSFFLEAFDAAYLEMS